MDKRANLRQYYQNQENTATEIEQFNKRTTQITNLEDTVIEAFNALIKFMDGKTTKTEVVNQLKSISTPDIDKVVEAVSKLRTDILTNQLDLKPVLEALNGLKSEITSLPGNMPTAPEQKESIKIANIDEISFDTSSLEAAINNLKLDPTIDVKAPIVKVEAPDLDPIKKVMLDVLNAINKQKPVEIPKTDLSKLEEQSGKTTKQLEEANKKLQKLVDKPVGGGGGGGNGTPYIDSTGKHVNVELTVDGKIPVEAGATSTYEGRNDTTTDTNLVYLAKAAPGTLTSEAAWQIKRYNKSAGHMSFADDVTTFTKVWDDRTSYGY